MMFTADHAIKDNRFICDTIPAYLDIADKVHNDRFFMKVYLAKARASVITTRTYRILFIRLCKLSV